MWPQPDECPEQDSRGTCSETQSASWRSVIFIFIFIIIIIFIFMLIIMMNIDQDEVIPLHIIHIFRILVIITMARLKSPSFSSSSPC